jgi:hypothetical protein
MANKLEFKDVPGKGNTSGNWRSGYHWKEGTVFVTRVTGPVTALVYMAGVNIDYDGSPTAYGPPTKPGDDKLEHAGPGQYGWYGVKALSIAEAAAIRKAEEDKKKRSNPGFKAIRPIVDPTATKDVNDAFPVIQQAGEPSPGHYVSKTATVFNASYPSYRQEYYWDSSKYPYGALSGKLRSIGEVQLHDFGLGVRLDRAAQTVFAFKDAGRDDFSLGEVSQKVFKNLGGVIASQNDFPVAYIVFPGSSAGKQTAANQFEPGVKEQLGKLALADNAEELPLLLAFYADAGRGRSGLPLLQTFQKDRSSFPRLANFRLVLAGLRNLGWPTTVGTIEQQMISQEMRRYMDQRQLQSDGPIRLA